MTSPSSLVIIGAGGHGRAVLDVAHSADVQVVAFVDAQLAGQQILGVDVLADVSDIAWSQNTKYFVAIGDNSIREKVVEKTRFELPDAVEATLVHGTAYVSPFSVIEPGCVVMSQAFVGPNCQIEKGCILNTGSQIDHDGHMHAFSSLGPKACLGGTVKLGRRSVVAIGATVKHGLNIGDDSLLAAQAYLHETMPDRVIYKGIPAKYSGMREVGDAYL